MKRSWYDSAPSVAVRERPAWTLRGQTALGRGAGADDERLHSSEEEGLVLLYVNTLTILTVQTNKNGCTNIISCTIPGRVLGGVL